MLMRVNLPREVESATLSYRVKFDANYDWTAGGKLPGLCDSGALSFPYTFQEHVRSGICIYRLQAVQVEVDPVNNLVNVASEVGFPCVWNLSLIHI